MSIGLDEKDLTECFRALDIGEIEAISYTQFVAGCLLSDEYIKDDTVYMVFRTWDVDRDGVLSLEDFNSFITSEYPGLLDKPYGKDLIAEFEELTKSHVFSLFSYFLDEIY